MKKSILLILSTLLILSISCVDPPNIPYDEFAIWVVSFSPEPAKIAKLSRELEIIHDFSGDIPEGEPVIGVNPDDKWVWLRTGTNEITVFDENWREEISPFTVNMVAEIKFNTFDDVVWIRGGTNLFAFRYDGSLVSSTHIDSFVTFTPIENNSGVWCVTESGQHIDKYDNNCNRVARLLTTDFMQESPERIFHNPQENAIWLSAGSHKGKFVKINENGTILSEIEKPDSIISDVNRINGRICYETEVGTTGIGLLDNDGSDLWFRALERISSVTYNDYDGSILYTINNPTSHELFRLNQYGGLVTHRASPFFGDRIRIAATETAFPFE